MIVGTATQLEPAASAHAPSPAGMDEGGMTAIENILARLGEDALGDYAVRILVAGSSPEVSGLATAFSLARALARDRRVILVELEAAGAGETPPGLCELIAGDASFAEVIDRDRGSRLHRITAGRRSVDPSDDLDLALEALSQTYDYVVLATPPVDAAPAARALAAEADFVVLAGIGRCHRRGGARCAGAQWGRGNFPGQHRSRAHGRAGRRQDGCMRHPPRAASVQWPRPQRKAIPRDLRSFRPLPKAFHNIGVCLIQRLSRRTASTGRTTRAPRAVAAEKQS